MNFRYLVFYYDNVLKPSLYIMENLSNSYKIESIIVLIIKKNSQ